MQGNPATGTWLEALDGPVSVPVRGGIVVAGERAELDVDLVNPLSVQLDVTELCACASADSAGIFQVLLHWV